MAISLNRAGLLRRRDHQEEGKVAFVELFFDLVFVFAITQLSHSILAHRSVAGLLEVGFLMLAVWWVWIYTTWVMNWLNPQTQPVRLMLFVLMLAGLVLTISIPEAFAGRGPAFAGAYVFMQVGRSLFACWVLRGHAESRYRNFLRISCWLAFAGVFWIAGAFADGGRRVVFWLAALAIEYIAPAAGFVTPGLGRSTTHDWDISGAHMAERCGLFVIIALGESLLVTGATFGEIEWTPLAALTFLTAFAGTVALWFVYFNLGAEHALERIARSEDPGYLARLAYTYLHIPIIAGIILVAASDEMILAHPGGQTAPLDAVAIVGGPIAFVAGNLLFKRAAFGVFARSHLTGLAALMPAAAGFVYVAPLTLAIYATAVLTFVGAWENIAVRRHRPDRRI
jgi:low temperature requirement protein LtrA